MHDLNFEAGEERMQPDSSRRRAALSSKVRAFYDQKGWVRTASGKLLDTELFGDTETGEIRAAGHRRREMLLRSILAESGCKPNFIECGCGGAPAIYLADLTGSYTGIDFSIRGISVAREKMREMPTRFVVADLCCIPFRHATFDVAYSAHVLYHIADSELQALAFNEIMRIVRPGGFAIFILANPRPLLFPLRLFIRLIADTPVLCNIVRKFRSSPLPYRPMTLSWMRKHLEAHGDVGIEGYAVPSSWFNRNVSERTAAGRILWRGVYWLEVRFPRLAARLGNYVLITVRKIPHR
jgi:ubiquinone/menaquinone biosynthesis C-methylase UbiE